MDDAGDKREEAVGCCCASVHTLPEYAQNISCAEVRALDVEYSCAHSAFEFALDFTSADNESGIVPVVDVVLDLHTKAVFNGSEAGVVGCDDSGPPAEVRQADSPQPLTVVNAPFGRDVREFVKDERVVAFDDVWVSVLDAL